jgi:hypothetical protein
MDQQDRFAVAIDFVLDVNAVQTHGIHVVPLHDDEVSDANSHELPAG